MLDEYENTLEFLMASEKHGLNGVALLNNGFYKLLGTRVVKVKD
jgi:hypothetical protein